MFGLISRFLERISTSKVLSRKKIKQLEELIDNKINDVQLFVEAFTHRSIIDGKKFKSSNERLEFLGDAVLGFVVAEYLFDFFKDRDEGYLTKIRSNFVNKNSLYEAAVRLDLMQFIFISEDLIHSSNLGIKTILADTFESLIGAIYLDCGIDASKKFIDKYLIKPNFKIGLHLTDDNYKSQLLEYTQSVKLDMPKYYVIKEEGPEHDRIFTVQVRIGNEILGVGKGKNKKSAEQEAAKEAIKLIEIGNSPT